MMYRLVAHLDEDSDSDLDKNKSIDSTATPLLKLIHTSTTSSSNRDIPHYISAEKILTELHKYMQHGVKMFEGQDQDEENSVDSDDDDTYVEKGSAANCEMDEPFDLVNFLRKLSEHTTKVKVLLKEEGVVQDDVLELARELSEQCRAIAESRVEMNQIGLKTLLGKTAELLHLIRPVDLDLLLQFLQAGQDAGDTMQDKDVLLLIGQTGCGKTSTIHYLAGSSFREIIVEGSDHLQIVNVAHPDLQNAKTSSSTRSVTKSVRSIDITTEHGETLAICDTPGFDDTDGVEVEISNGYGMVRAIHRAKRVKPVLVLSEKGIGDRFGAVSQDLRTISKLVGASASCAVDPKPFAYLFTKYDVKYAGRLHEQFRAKYKQLTAAEREDVSFSAFVRDIKKKTKPLANIVTPLVECNRSPLLSALVEGEWYENPASSFSFFVSESSLNKLKVQLQLTCTYIRKALDQKNTHLVMTKLLQLVEIGNHLHDAVAFARQGVKDVSSFLGRYKESLSSSTHKCKELRDYDGAFKRELKNTKEIVEILVAFHPILNKWSSFEQYDSIPVSSDFCVRSIAALTDCLEERVFSRRGNMRNFISTLRQQKQAAVMDLSHLKDVADTFTHLAHVGPRIVWLYQECSDALITGIFAVLEDTYEYISVQEVASGQRSRADAGQFMPHSFLLDLKADFDLVSIADELEAHGIVLGDGHERFAKLWHDVIAIFNVNLQNNFTAVTGYLYSDRDLEIMVDMDHQGTVDVRRVLSFLIDHPGFLSHLGQMNVDIAAKKLQELESYITSFILCLVEKIEANFSIAKEEHNQARLQDVAQYLVKADEICIVFRDDNQSKRVAMLKKSLEDYFKSLSAKQLAMLEQAKYYLRVIEAQDPTSILYDISIAWDEWETAIARVSPKKEKQSMVKRLFSVFSLANINESSSKESDFIRWLKAVKIKIGKGLRRQLEQSFKALDYPSSILFLVKVVTMESTTLIAWILHPQNARELDRLHQLYTDAQLQLSQFIGSFDMEKLMKAGDFVALNNTLNDMKENAETWQQIRKTAQRMDPKNNSQSQLRDGLLAFKDYYSQCHSLLSQVQLIERAFYNISFLDDARADSINEHDQNTLYRGVVSSLSVFQGMQILRGHLPTEVDVTPLLEHVENQIECIYKYLVKLMTSFPNIEADFEKVYIWRSNFHSIERCFKTATPRVAGTARRFREEVDREMDLALKRIEPPADFRKIVLFLCLLKKASINISCWRSNINQVIDELLLSMSKMAHNCGHFVLGLELELKNVEGPDEAVALQILSEHKCFEGAMNVVFNSATACQGIQYVADAIDLSFDAKDTLLSMYANFQDQYKDHIERGLVASKSDTMMAFFQELVDEAKLIAMDYSIDYRSQLTRLTSFIFAYWSLKSMNSFVSGTMSNENTYSAAIEYLMKPHAAQVVSIWCLLNFEHDQYQILKNHFVEILTGEGKSITLGVTAIILAMLDCDVVCVCYSAYLSSRDYASFQSMFEDFGALSSIKYSTVEDACRELCDRGGDTRSLSNDIAWKTTTKRADSEHGNDRERAQVLLIDEVDVFFKKDFYGETYNPLTSLYHRSIAELLQHIWTNRHSLNQSSLSTSPIARSCVDLFPKDMQPIISKQIRSMLTDAKSADSHNYIVCDSKICYKYFDGLNFNHVHGYFTTFAGIKEHENGGITTKEMNERLCVYLSCGKSSYAEIPTVFDVILGVTGTLASLGQSEKDVLHHQFGIDKMTYIPSVYGKNKLLFAGDNPRDVIIADDDANFHLELRNEINIRRKPDKEGSPLRAVLAFFESRKQLEAFYESDKMIDIKSVARILTEEVSAQDKEGAFLQATRSGAITLMIREFGRGTDFKCFDSNMLEGGGVHVIQAFFSTEIAEEIQIKGRAARQGARGSYSMVLHAKALATNMGLGSSDIESMRLQSKFYSYLNSKRSYAYTEICNQRKDIVEKAERCHYETVDYKRCALDDKRKEAITYLEKWNGVASDTPCSVATKALFIAQKRKRATKREEKERKKRSEARLITSTPPCYSDTAEETMEEDEFFDAFEHPDPPIMNVDRTHYNVLGVLSNADTREIESAFRKASLIFHPDRNNDPNASDHFNRLTEAKEVLSCPSRRRDYDAGLL